MPNRVEELQRSWAACTAADEQKHAVVQVRRTAAIWIFVLTSRQQGLFEQVEALSSELADTERELLDKKDALQQIRSRESNAIERIKDLERQRVGHPRRRLSTLPRTLTCFQDRHIFAAVLIDGDNMPVWNIQGSSDWYPY